MNNVPQPERLPVAVRAFASQSHSEPAKRKHKRAAGPKSVGHSEWALVFDTETTTDAAQNLRFGVYQVRESGELRLSGVFYDPDALTEPELDTLRSYADERGLEVRTTKEFVEEVFFPYVYKSKGLCIGLNLPFDLSRIAIGHNSARGNMRGGFSLKLSEGRYRPRLQVKHLNSRSALIRFTVPAKQRSSRGMRSQGRKVSPRRGHFVDVRTLAGALLGGSWSLGKLSEHLEVEHAKLETEEHGQELTREYLEYAVQDVQSTWECFDRLRSQYEGYGLTQTPVDKIYSEAGLGKAYLKQMGIQPWKKLQPDFPPNLIGIIMSTYYGGRSEVRIRREVRQVLYCDFLSMYPTVCTLMNLWRFVTAERMEYEDATGSVQRFLERVTLEDLHKPQTWPKLQAIVKVRPSADTFPVRARYGDEPQHTIGLNYLTSEEPLWFTLADCVASKLLTGKSPEVLEALSCRPVGLQSDLESIDIAGNPDYRINPAKDDFYKRLIDLRSEVKAAKKQASGARETVKADRLDAEQLALKLTANATSYGIFVELNVAEQDKPQEVTCYGATGEGFPSRVHNLEEPGEYFHPLLATLITGGARLMLAVAECLAADRGLDWAFCDTDSMALARPESMDEAEFLQRATEVSEWFTGLNPYEDKAPLFKLEEANHSIRKGKPTEELEPLYCLAVSSKRYTLFNLDKRSRPVLRKASAHGLGHLLPPYTADEAPTSIPKPSVPLAEIGTSRWQYDLWYRIVKAALGDTPEQTQLDDLPGFQGSAVSRYAATTPKLLRWFDKYNEGKHYREQVKPFNFLLSFQPGFGASGLKSPPKPVSAYNKDLEAAAADCFDRRTCEAVSYESLKTYQEALARHHLHSEDKFHNGAYTSQRATSRRHVLATVSEYIGKEANRWEEQFHLGLDTTAQTEYGASPLGRGKILQYLSEVSEKFGQRCLSEASGVSLSEVSAVLLGKRSPNASTLSRLRRAAVQLERASSEEREHSERILDEAIQFSQRTSVREFARCTGVDPANLRRVLKGQRKLSQRTLEKLQDFLGKDS